jgi:hypothetical protein
MAAYSPRAATYRFLLPPGHLPVMAGEVNEAGGGLLSPLLVRQCVAPSTGRLPLLHARHWVRLGPQCGSIVTASRKPVYPARRKPLRCVHLSRRAPEIRIIRRSLEGRDPVISYRRAQHAANPDRRRRAHAGAYEEAHLQHRYRAHLEVRPARTAPAAAPGNEKPAIKGRDS